MEITETTYGNPTEFAGKAAIVTGGGAAGDGIGNGRAAAILMARAGASVFVVDLVLELAERTAEMIRQEGGTACAHQADVSKADQCEAMVDAAVNRYGRLDILDNNVGIMSRGSVVTESEKRWKQVMDINVNSMFLTSKYAVPAMVDSGDGGAIVNVSSISAMRPKGWTAYSTSKGAVITLTQAMAMDHAKDGIRVNCVAPGPVYTPMVYGDGMSETAREVRRKASPLGIEGSGWDIGRAVAFLASPQSRYITGQVLIIDGGTTLASPPRDTK